MAELGKECSAACLHRRWRKGFELQEDVIHVPQVLEGAQPQVAGMPVRLHIGILVLARQALPDTVKGLRVSLHCRRSASPWVALWTHDMAY